MNIVTIAERVKAIIADQLSKTLDEVKGDVTLVSLGADSLDAIELIMSIEDDFLIEISDESADKIKTVQQAIDYVANVVKS